MLNYIEYLAKMLDVSSSVVIVFVIVFFVIQAIGEIAEFSGKIIVPEFMKIRKYFARKKQERETAKETVNTLKEVKALLANVNQHYSDDNIKMRDSWMKSVDTRLEEDRAHWQQLIEKMDQNGADMLTLMIDNKRNEIINFASKVVDVNSPVTREQFNRIFKIHGEYEEIIKNNDLTNGEVDIAFRIITEAYESHMRNHTFIEDIRGYDKT